jgi:hypothetical protein|tara:strand:+ start:180 stop:497 length:318 start_codon:yes stop_codon:yes gene_type:complete
MSLDQDAVRKAYPDVVTIDNDKAYKEDGSEVTLVQSNIDAARITLDAEAVANKYKTDRTTNGSVVYKNWREQLAMLYDDIVTGKLDATGSFAAHNKAVKDANPKP